MALSTYAELQDTIGRWLFGRTDLDANDIPDFIRMAEAQFERDLRHHEMVTVADLTVDAKRVDLPADHLETIRVTLDSEHEPIENVTLTQLSEWRQRNRDTAGIPRLMAHVGGQLEFWPSPGDTYDAEIIYYAEIPKLGGATTTNWILARHSDLYLFGALFQAAIFLRDQGLLQSAGQSYNGVLSDVKRENERQMFATPMKVRGKPR